MSILITLLIAAVIGLLVKLCVGLFAPRIADMAGLLAFVIVILARLGGV